MSPLETATVLAALTAAFPPVVMAEETLAIYERFLADVSLVEASQAVANWICRETRFPRISELRAYVERERGTSAPDLDLAWTEVETKIRRIGSYGSPSWSHPAIRAAVSAIGWRDLCATTDPGVTRAHFQRAYDSARKREADPGAKLLAKSIADDVQRALRGPIESVQQALTGGVHGRENRAENARPVNRKGNTGGRR